MTRRRGREAKKQREQQDGGEQGPGASGCRAAAAAAAAPAPGPVKANSRPPCRSSAAARARQVRDRHRPSSGCSPPVPRCCSSSYSSSCGRPGPVPGRCCLAITRLLPKHRRAMFSLTDSQMGRSRPSHTQSLSSAALGWPAYPQMTVRHSSVQRSHVEELATVGQVAAPAPGGCSGCRGHSASGPRCRPKPARARARVPAAAAARPGQARLNGALSAFRFSVPAHSHSPPRGRALVACG